MNFKINTDLQNTQIIESFIILNIFTSFCLLCKNLLKHMFDRYLPHLNNTPTLEMTLYKYMRFLGVMRFLQFGIFMSIYFNFIK